MLHYFQFHTLCSVFIFYAPVHGLPVSLGVMHKMKIIIISLLLLFPTVVLSAALDYAQYKEDKIFNRKPATPDLTSHEDARTYRTELKRQSKKGPNFAGHYTIITIGCGAGCAQVERAGTRVQRVG